MAALLILKVGQQHFSKHAAGTERLLQVSPVSPQNVTGLIFALGRHRPDLFHLLFSGSSGSNCSKNEGRKSGGSGSEPEVRSLRAPSERSVAPPSERSVRSSVSHRSAHSHSIGYGPGLVYGPPGLPPQPQHMSTAAPGAPPGRELAAAPPELTASRQSLRLAVGNAGEFFVDVM